MKTTNIISLIIWTGWLIYGFTCKNKSMLRICAIFGGIVGILFFLEKLLR